MGTEYKTVTEAEMIDVLLGDADPGLEARVRQAVRHDLKAAALYAQWSQVIPAVQAGAEPLKAMNTRVRERVMRRISEQAPLAGAQYFLGDVTLLESRRFALPEWMLSRRMALAVAVLLLAGVLGPLAWQWLTPTLTADLVSGEVLASRTPGGPVFALRPGSCVKLPVQLRAAGDARAEFRLTGGSRLSLAGAAELTVLGRRRVLQTGGAASYDVAHKWLTPNFTVRLPEGRVEDLGTAFGVEVHDNHSAMVRVDEGRIRVHPARGRSVEARAGERALMDAASALVEPVPVWTDLAAARAHFTTRLVRQGPAPQAAPLPSPPAGAREVVYPSGGLLLKAWVNADPTAATPRPVVVFLADGATLGAGDWAAAEPYRQAGFTVMMPLLRGQGGNPGNYELLWGEVDDVVAAGRFAAALPGVDPHRIYLAGRGQGGTLALLAAMLPSPYAAATPIGALADTGPLFAGAAEVPFDQNDPRERLLRLPRAFPDSLRLPVQLVYSAGDGSTQMDEGGKLARAATLLGKDCRVSVAEGGGAEAQAAAVRQSLGFFQQLQADRLEQAKLGK